MNVDLFNNIRAKKDDVLWDLPIRWWEDEYKPHRVVVLKDCDEHDKSLYVMSDLYGHPVYIDRCFVFYDLENANKAILLLRQLDELVDNDGLEELMKRIFPHKRENSA